MKNVSLNKKGFTLVELLAVIVILALLIVITANTVLPMMNKTKKSGMVTYAERVVSNATASYQADSISGGATTDRYYKISNLMGAMDYFGCVYVQVVNTGAQPEYTYNVRMMSATDKLHLDGAIDPGTSTFDDPLDDLVKSFESTIPKGKTEIDAYEAKCGGIDSNSDGDYTDSGEVTPTAGWATFVLPS